MRLLAAVGDCEDPNTWSGIPYYLLKWAVPTGILHGGLHLSTHGYAWRLARWFWNAKQAAATLQIGGFQWSESFLARLWADAAQSLGGCEVVNCFQLFPRLLVDNSDIVKWYYIDQTLSQLFSYYGTRFPISTQRRDAIVSREREGYRSAKGVVAHSSWAAQSLVADYGIPASRVHVVVPGANLCPAAYQKWVGRRAPDYESRPLDPLRLVFVGRDWMRKGLDRLLEAHGVAQRMGARLRLTVIGCAASQVPKFLQAIPNVDWRGVISKHRDMDHFINTIAAHHVGCLLSRAEAGGIGLREYQALGLATLGPLTGGAPDHAEGPTSILVAPSAPVSDIAGHLYSLWKDQARLSNMLRLAEESREEALWSRSVRRLGNVLDGC